MPKKCLFLFLLPRQPNGIHLFAFLRFHSRKISLSILIKKKIYKISEIKVNMVFSGMSRGFLYLRPNRSLQRSEFLKSLTTKNWTDFVICTNISIARVQKQLNKALGSLLFLNPLEIFLHISVGK